MFYETTYNLFNSKFKTAVLLTFESQEPAAALLKTQNYL
jgi:hypothetical protein